MNHGSLFSGFGGFDRAAEMMGWTNLFNCEINRRARMVLNDNFPDAKSYADIRDTDFTIWRGRIDVLSGGFPCQDASRGKTHGGGQLGLSGEKTGLYYQMLRAVGEIRPRYVIAENVPNIISVNGGGDFHKILLSLHRIGYDAEWRCLYASDLGAPHCRGRLYLVAYPGGLGPQEEKHVFPAVVASVEKAPRVFAGATVPVGGAWDCEPPSLSMDDGVPPGMGPGIDAILHGCGNAVVPAVALQVFQWIQDFDSRI